MEMRGVKVKSEGKPQCSPQSTPMQLSEATTVDHVATTFTKATIRCE
jgi:hypothetical protein